MSFDPLAAVGAVIAIDGAGVSTHAGSCFLFRHSHYALTAAHCVPPSAEGFRVELPRLARAQPVLQVHTHPEADLAVLVTENPGGDDG